MGGVSRAGRRKNQRLGAVINGALTCFQDEGAKLLTNLGAAGFAGGDDTVSAGAECFIQQGELGGFAGTVASFDHDKKPAATGRVGGKILRIGGVAESIHHP